jgi:hypothetical protein
MEKLQSVFKECRLLVAEDHLQISGESIVTSWRTIGTPQNQEKFVRMMVKDKDITSLEY